MDLALVPCFAVGCVACCFVIISQATQVIQLVNELEHVFQLVLQLLGTFVLFNDSILIKQEVLVDATEGLHGLGGVLAVHVGSGLFI